MKSLTLLVVLLIAASTYSAEINQGWPSGTTICYDYVGCFSNNPPFNNTQLYLPIDPILIDTSFQLFTKKNPTAGQFLSYRNVKTIENSNFDKNLPLKIVVHGFQNDINSSWLYKLKDALLTENVNVIVVAWGNGAIFPHYVNASSNVRVVGREISVLTLQMASFFFPSDSNLFRIHCIGHSLGSHICGHAGEASKSSGLFYDRISGMDPAGPNFEDTNELVRLDTSDAKYVDIYHTNAGQLITASFGIVAPIGHIDFYVNGGSSQPGCSGVSCSHSRVTELYIESITSKCPFLAFKCESYTAFQNGDCRSCTNEKCSQLGYFSDQYKTRGSVYLATRSKAPFCGSQYIFSIRITSDTKRTAGEIVLTFANENVSLTGTGEEIKSGSYELKRLITISNDVVSGQTVSITFNKKSKGVFNFWEEINPTFSYDKITMINLMVGDETLSYCETKNTIGDKETKDHVLSGKKCL